MKHLLFFLACAVILTSACRSSEQQQYSLDTELLNAMGAKYKDEYESELRRLEGLIAADPNDANALLSHAETNVVLFIFGLSSRESTIPAAHAYLEKATAIDSVSCKFHTVDGMLKFLDWDWTGTGEAFRAAIEADPEDPLLCGRRCACS